MNRRLRAWGLLGLVLLVAVGCAARGTAGTPVVAKADSASAVDADGPPGAGPAPEAPAGPIGPGKLGALPLSLADFNAISGADFDRQAETTTPPDSKDIDRPACSALLGMDRGSFGDGDFTAFRALTYQESTTGSKNYLGFQRLATYPDRDRAGAVFAAAFASAGACDGVDVHDNAEHPGTRWRIHLDGPAEGRTVQWRQFQLTDGEPFGWVCASDARVTNNVIVEVMLCQAGNGLPAVTAIADQIGSRVPPALPANPPPPSSLVPAAKIDALLIAPGQLGALVGSSFGYQQNYLRPFTPVDLDDRPTCAVLFGLDRPALGSTYDWTAYRGNRLQQAQNRFDHILDQRVVTFPDADTAARTFRDGLTPAQRCEGAVVHAASAEPHVRWQLQSPRVTADHAVWSNTEMLDGKPATWRCAFDTRVHSNVLVQVQVCQHGDGARVAGTVADRIVAGMPR